jgi:cellulose synthase/poly-beta-1,6-N-acetylglucosamine synthase-like glycosyltransferase
MSTVLSTMGAVLSALLLIPSAFFMIECLAARRRRRPGTIPVRAPSTVVLMPAHDEEPCLGATLGELFSELDRDMTVLVVADNCSDRTAEIAESLGARVVSRDEPSRVGKGFAIEWGVRALEDEPPDVVVILDADCRIDAFSLRRIADLAHHTQKPVQAEYAMEASGETALARLGAFAFAVRNRVRPRGLKRMGVPVHLTGTGMAFPFGLLRSAPKLGGHLAEDQLLGIELSLGGRAPILAEEAAVTSVLPGSAVSARRQRGRWEGGSLALLRSHAPRVLRDAFHYRRAALFGLALDLAIPPLALLCLLALVAFALVAASVASGAGAGMWIAGVLPISCVLVGVFSAWRSVGRELLGLTQLAFAPLYVLWKVPLYVSMLVRGVPARWERTIRERSE